GRRARRERSERDARTAGYSEQRHAQFHQYRGRGGGRAGDRVSDPGSARARHPQRASSRVRAFIDLGRPFTLVAPALGFISGALTAVGAAPREFWDVSLLVPVLLGSAMAALLNAGNNALNQIYDLEIDRVNKPK